MKRLEILQEKLDKKQQELDDYVSNRANDYLSEEAEKMRREIAEILKKINKLEENEKELKLEEATELLEKMKISVAPIYRSAINRILVEIKVKGSSL